MTGVVIFAAAVAFWWFVIRNWSEQTALGTAIRAGVVVAVGVYFASSLAREIRDGDRMDRGECISPIVTVYGRDC